MPADAALVIGAIAAVICTVLILIYVTPAKKREGLNPFFKFLHDLFNFKWLVLEQILKVIYIFTTVACVLIGFLLIFSGQRDWYGNFHSAALPGILIMILGPILIRLSCEGIMMLILLVKNVMSINSKLPSRPANATAAPAEAEYVFCGQCGARFNASDGVCPNCGAPLK